MRLRYFEQLAQNIAGASVTSHDASVDCNAPACIRLPAAMDRLVEEQ